MRDRKREKDVGGWVEGALASVDFSWLFVSSCILGGVFYYFFLQPF
jgi:membrane associated rhomboid family serine protease